MLTKQTDESLMPATLWRVKIDKLNYNCKILKQLVDKLFCRCSQLPSIHNDGGNAISYDIHRSSAHIHNGVNTKQ